jgi:hypothetical protein
MTLAVFLLAATLAMDDVPSPIGNEPSPMVLVLGEDAVVRRFQPLDPATFGENGQRLLDYDFEKSGAAGLTRRKVDGEEPGGKVVPLGLGEAVVDGSPCVVLEMDKPQGKAVLAKGVGFSLRLRAVEPNKLRETFGPGVYEGLAWLRILQRDPRDPLMGERKHLLRLSLVIPGRRVAQLSVTGTPAVGQRVKVVSAVEEVLARGEEGAASNDRLRVELVPEGEAVATLELPWPVPAGAWDPRELGPHGERSGWAVPTAWLDEPILAGDSGSKAEVLVGQGPARSIVHRQSLRLPPLFAPGTLSARITPVGSAPQVTKEIPVRSGLLAGPSLAFLNDRLYFRAVLARGDGGIANPPEKLKVRVDPPSGQGKTFSLARDGRATGYASYALKPEDYPKVLAPGYYKITPATGDPALDEALGGEVVVLAALEKDDARLRRERVAFLGATPLHWPLIVWLDSGRKDGSLHRAETGGAIVLKSVRGPEEIGALSLSLSQFSVPPRQRPHDNQKDGEIRFSGPGKAPMGPWTFDRQGISLDFTADIDGATRRQPPLAKGPRERFARFIVEGIGPDKEKIGRIFREPCSYKIAAHWDYYLEWAWLPGLILLSLLLWWYIRRVGGGKNKVLKKAASSTSPARTSAPAADTGRFGKAWTEPEKQPEPSAPPEPPRRGLPSDPGPPSRDGKRRIR